MDNNIICIFVPNGVKPISRQKNLPYKWEEEDGTFYSVMPREVYNDYLELEEENKKLNEELKDKQKVIQYYRKEKKNLNEKVRFLEECLDRKEKLNEKYRKEIEKLKSTYVYNAKQVRDIC